MKKSLARVLMFAFLLNIAPVFVSASVINLQDDFQGYTVNTAWTTANKGTDGLNWGQNWKMRKEGNALIPVKTVTEDIGNSFGSSNKVVQLGIDWTNSTNAENSNFIETYNYNFTSVSKVTLKMKLKAPQSTLTANGENFIIQGNTFASFDGSNQTTAVSLFRFQNGGFRVNNGSNATGGIGYGNNYTAGSWYDITIMFSKGTGTGGLNTIQTTVLDLANPSNSFTDAVRDITAGFDIFKTTGGRITVINTPNTGFKTSQPGWRYVAIDDFHLYDGDIIAAPQLNFVSSIPNDGDVNVVASSPMTVLFDQNLTSVESVTISGGAQITSSQINASNSKQLDITYSNLQPLTQYTVTINNIVAGNGASIASKEITFKTREELNIPKDDIIVHDNFEYSTLDSEKWSVRPVAGGSNDPVAENIGNEYGSSNRVLRIGVAGSTTAATNHFVETKSQDFTGYESVNVQFMIKAPADNINDASHRADILFTNLEPMSGTTKAGPVLMRMKNGSIFLTNGTNTVSGSLSGGYTPGEWYKFKLSITKAADASSADVINVSLENKNGDIVASTTQAITTFALFNSTSGTFRMYVGAAQNTSGNNYCVDDFIMYKTDTNAAEKFEFVSSIPVNGETNVAQNVQMKVLFSEGVGTVNNVSINNGATVTPAIDSINAKQLNLTFGNLKGLTTYTVGLNGILGENDVALDPMQITFTTEHDFFAGSVKYFVNYGKAGQREIGNTGLEAGEITAVVPLKNRSIASRNLTMFIAHYSENKLAGVQSHAVNGLAFSDTSSGVAITLQVGAVLPNDKLKLFVWENDLKPLAVFGPLTVKNNVYDLSYKDANIQYIGRWTENTDYIQTDWGGTYLKTGFTGTTAKIELAGNVNKLYVSIDGLQQVLTNVTTGIVDLTPTPLSEGIHTLVIGQAASTASNQSVKFKRLVLDNGAQTTYIPVSDTIVEFIGDSITAGYNLPNEAIDNYSWIASEAEGVEHTQIARSGLCLTNGISDPSGNTIGMSVRYFQSNSYNGAAVGEWDFSVYQPKMIFINIGQNDSSRIAASDYVNTYYQFLKAVRAKNPDARIFALRPISGALSAQIQSAVELLNGRGDSKISFVDTTGWIDITNPAYMLDTLHPNRAGNELIAAKIREIIRQYK